MRSLLAFTLLALALAGCSKRDPSTSFAEAEQAEAMVRMTADTTADRSQRATLFAPVIEQYRTVLKEFPDSSHASQALFRIAAIYNNDTEEYEKAIGAYREYVDRYPRGERHAVSMFLIGYIYHNQIGNLDSAAAAYQRFLQQYPDHEMAMSAQFELNTLGKSPDELLGPEAPAAPGQPLARTRPR